MSKLAAKKKMLVAESEVYRQLLRLEIQTFRVYGKRTRRRLSSISTYLPLVMSGIPIISGLFRKKRGGRFPLKRLGSLFLLGWKAYRQFAPFLTRSGEGKAESTETAAEEYLAKRL